MSVQRAVNIAGSIVCCALWYGMSPAKASAPTPGSYIIEPDTIVSAGKPFALERGLLFVPENRRRADSRLIAINFLRFESHDKSTHYPPVFMLAGGPGSELDFGRSALMEQVQLLRRDRDVVYVSQRGFPGAPGLVPKLFVKTEPAPLSLPSTAAERRRRERTSWQNAIPEWLAKGVDLAGYDILNIVDDVHELRAALGYDKIVLRGCSFGSQWSLAYMKRWPESVDRALLGGIEPLDYGYDSPKWLWASIERLARLAETDSHFAPYVPRGGLIEALKDSIAHLEKEPVAVSIVTHPTDKKPVEVVLGADDLRRQIRDADGFLGRTRLDNLASWPRFIIEMRRGDYRYLAAKTWQRRVSGETRPMILMLIDNSLGISAARDEKLLAEPEMRWVGEINENYRVTRDLTPTPDVGDDFRSDWHTEIPVLMVNGDLDWATPLENAQHALRYLKKGHLLTVEGGTHCTDFWELPERLPDVSERLYRFIRAPADASSANELFADLPDTVSFVPPRFILPTGPTLYDEWLAERFKQGGR